MLKRKRNKVQFDILTCSPIIAAIITGAIKPEAQPRVLAKPKAVPTRCGAISMTIGVSPPMVNPLQNILAIRTIIITSGRFPRLGMIPKQRAVPKRAEYEKIDCNN